MKKFYVVMIQKYQDSGSVAGIYESLAGAIRSVPLVVQWRVDDPEPLRLVGFLGKGVRNSYFEQSGHEIKEFEVDS